MPPRPPLYRAAAIAAIIVGSLVRIKLYAAARPLWIDEAMLSLNIAGRSFLDLLRPLDYEQTAPILFLWGARLATLVAGVNEYALRALPLLAGIGLLILLWRVASRMLGEEVALLATIIAALSPLAIAFSNEVKQYSVDAFVTLLVLWPALDVLREPRAASAWRRLAIWGVVALLISQPSAFILAGVGVALVAERHVRAAPGWLSRCATMSAAWLAVFATLYFTSYRAAASSYMKRFWEATFLTPGVPDIGLRATRAAAHAFLAPVLEVPASAAAAIMGAGVFLVGTFAVFRRSGRSAALLVAMPYLCVLGAAAYGAYPVMNRLLLFLSPLLFLTIAAALTALSELLPRPARGPAYVLIVLLILNWPGRAALWYARNPPRPEDSRPLVEELERAAGGDAVYVFSRGVPAWIFYSTDWKAPDVARLRWMTRMAGANGPIFENAPSRGRPVRNEGDHLVYDYRDRREVLGIATGMEYRAGTRYLQHVPDTGWADNEVRRIRAAADSAAWIFASHHTAPQIEALLAAVELTGGEISYSRTLNGAMIARLRFTTPRGGAALEGGEPDE